MLLVCLTNTILCVSQSKIYYNQDCEITIKEFASFYSISKVDTGKRIFVGKVRDYSMDSILIGELEYDQNGEKNGSIKRFKLSGEIKLEGVYKKNKIKGDWSLGKTDFEVSSFVRKKRLDFQIDSLEVCLISKEEFVISKFIRRNDYPEIQSLLRTERKPSAVRTNDGALNPASERPSFPDGMKALNNFVVAFLGYPAKAIIQKIKGQVIIEFTIMPDGSTTDFKVVKALGYGCDEEAIRVAKLLPDWTPGYQRGRAVKSKVRVPITF